MRLLVTVILIFISVGSLGEEEPLANIEPPAGEEPSAQKEPLANIEPSAQEKPSALIAQSVFEQAQIAAAAAKYEDVISILTGGIEKKIFQDDKLAIAYSNRGIAYSLLQRYGLAVQDLQLAIRLNPEHPLTLNHLGILAEHVEQNFAKAAEWYNKGASLGYAASQVNLGNLLRSGQGVARDSARAVRLYELALEQDYDVALVALGEMYIDGTGIKRNPARGVSLLQEGVSRGVVTGHYYLGIAFEKGTGVAIDYDQARLHYRNAAIQGHAPSQGALGYLYRRGNGVDKDFVEAVKWYRLAAEQGNVLAANRLAWLMATCPVKEICNGKVALEFAGLAVQNERSATNLDSLAAAYARVGEFDRALQVINEVLADESLSSSARTKYARRIDRYSNGIPFQL
jgi:TPR repeat protein